MYLVYDRIANDSIPHTCLKMVLSTYFHVSFQSFSHRNCMTGSPKGDVGYDQYTVPVVPDTVAIESTFAAFL